jgi:hypothetical protein
VDILKWRNPTKTVVFYTARRAFIQTGGNEMNYSYRFTLLSLCVLLTVVLTAGVATADISTFTANLSGANEVPPNASTATGVAILTVDSEGGLTGLPLQIGFSGLSSAQTGAHVHLGGAGVNGGVIHPLPLGSPLNTTMDLADLFEIASLGAGDLYVNIHSVNFPGGEIRGQLILSSTVATENTTWGNIKSLYR